MDFFGLLGALLATVIGNTVQAAAVAEQARGFWDVFIFWMKVISAVIAVVSGLGIFFVFLKTLPFLQKIDTSKRRGVGITAVDKSGKVKWERFMERFERGTDDNASMLIVDADSVVDGILKEMRIPGDGLGEKLKYLSGEDLLTIEGAWQAHKVRNMIAHTPDVKISMDRAKRVVHQFCVFLEELDAI